MSFNIEVESGKTVKLPTAGKYCDRDILVTAQGGGYTEEDVAEAIEQGKRAEYDRFWDAYQENGNRADYSSGFYGAYWNETTFRPKYDIRPTNPVSMFSNNAIVDLGEQLKECGVVLDTSRCTNINNLFYYSKIVSVPTISAVGCTSALVSTFAQSTITNIEALVLKEDGSNTFNGTFNNASYLTNITIVGTIGQNGFEIRSWRLSKDSVISVINALSSTTSGLSVTLHSDPIISGFETSPGAKDGLTSEEWTALANTKSNWTINLV